MEGPLWSGKQPESQGALEQQLLNWDNQAGVGLSDAAAFESPLLLYVTPVNLLVYQVGLCGIITYY